MGYRNTKLTIPRSHKFQRKASAARANREAIEQATTEQDAAIPAIEKSIPFSSHPKMSAFLGQMIRHSIAESTHPRTKVTHDSRRND